MNTLELNNEILRNLAELGEDETYLKKVSEYIKKMVSKKRSVEITDELKKEIEEAEEQIVNGECTILRTKEDIEDFFKKL